MKKRRIQIVAAALAASAVMTLCVGVNLWTKAEEQENAQSLSQRVADLNMDMGAETVVSYFTASDGVTLTPNVDTPNYIKEKRNSLLVTTGSGSTVTYHKVIDVSDTTKEDLLVEWQPIPKTVGMADMTQMIVRLEDAENPKYYVNVSMHRYTFNDGAKDVTTHFLAQPNTAQTYYGWRYGMGMTNNLQWGTMVRSCWVGQKNHAGKSYSNGMKLYYDNDEHALYTAIPADDTSDFDTDGDGKLLIVDMDDPAHMGADKSKLWKGFPSNKIKISFLASKLETDTAQYMIYSIDGQKFDGVYLNDVTPPNLTVNQLDYTDDSLPIGKAGEFYPFFSATAQDKISGNVDVKVRVYKNGEELYHTGNGFVPTSTGEYTVEYVAADGCFNETTKSYLVTVENSISAMQCEITETVDALNLHDESLKNASGHYPINLYYPVKLPEMAVEGGSGKAKVETIITYNGNTVKITDNTFVAQNKGVYVITYVATDYIGNTAGKTYTLEATYSDIPQLTEPILPTAVLLDKALELPKVDSLFYTVWGQKVKAYDTITIYKTDKTTVIKEFDGSQPAIYTPTATDGEKVYVEYATAKEKGATAVKYGQEIALQKSKKLSDRFLLGEDVTMDETDLGLNFTFGQDGNTIRYINPLSVFDGLSLEFIVPAEQNNYEEIRFTFTDSIDKTRRLSVNIYKNPNETATTSYIALNGDRSKQGEISASFYGNVIANFLFTLNQDGSVSHSDLGLENAPSGFKGFESGYVYMEISVYGIDSEIEKSSTVKLYRLKNQILGNIEDDFIKPILYLTNEPIGITTLGSLVEIPQAFASDVFDKQVIISVKVTFGDKTVYTAQNEFGKLDVAKILATDYGTYTITYKAIDASGNSVTKNYMVRVRDNVAPTLTIEGNILTNVRAGDKLSFPKVYASDNVDAELTIYAIVIDPMNWYSVFELGEEFVVQMKGRYIVKFYCADACENQTYSQDYYFTAE